MSLKAGVIGLGVGEAHIEGYQSYPDCEVIAACDIQAQKVQEFQRKFSELFLTTNATEVLKNPEINVVSIASYDDCHYEQVIQALEEDKHVFVEKPLCLHEKEARHIREVLTRKPHLRMSSNLILRKSPRFQFLKEEMRRGAFGELFALEGDYNYGRIHKVTEEWRGDLEFYSIVHGGGVHIIDLFHWLTGEKIEEVKAYGNKIATDGTKFRFNDFVTCLLKFPSGLLAKMSVNFGCVMPHFHPFRVYGTEATFENGYEEGFLYRSREKDSKPERVRAPYPGVHKGDLIRSFLDSIEGKADPEVDANDIFEAMSVCFAIEKAVKEEKAVKVNYI